MEMMECGARGRLSAFARLRGLRPLPVALKTHTQPLTFSDHKYSDHKDGTQLISKLAINGDESCGT